NDTTFDAVTSPVVSGHYLVKADDAVIEEVTGLTETSSNIEHTVYYGKLANWVPNKPGEEKPTPLPYPDPTPENPTVPGKPTVTIPYVPGYTPQDPDGQPLTPVDPNDPSKGYIPPVPKNPGENTHIPYVPNEPTVPEGKLVPSKPIPEKPAKPAEPAKEMTPPYMKQGTEELPNTGDATGQSGMVYGAAALGLTALLAAVKKKSENED
ncbi:mucin-binding protein, partial [Streptococcus himalayensis]